MAASVVFAYDFIQWYPSLPLGGLAIAVFLYIFAILEFINYFYIQLSYNLSGIQHLMKIKKWKNSSLNKDFKRMKKLEL